MTPQSSSLWHPSLAAQGDSGFKNGIVRGVPFLGKYSCLVDVISAIFFFCTQRFPNSQPDPLPAAFQEGPWGSWSLSVWKSFPSMCDAR